MRILLVCDGYPPMSGGLEYHVERLARYLDRAGHAISVVTANGSGNGGEPWDVVVSSTLLARMPGVHQVANRRLPPPWPDPAMVRTIEDAAQRLEPDVVHAHGWCSASAKVVARRRNIPLVVTLHDYGMLCPMRSLLNGGTMCSHVAGPGCVRCPGSDQSTAKRLVLASGIALTKRYQTTATSYLAVSNVVAEVHRNSGVSGPIAVVPNFIDDPDQDAAPTPKDGPVLFVGPPSAAKGLDVLLRAHQILVSRGKEVALRHVGGTADDAGHRSIVRSGRLHGRELELAFATSRVVAVPSTWQEPCPTVALEAMAAGRAVVGSAVGGLVDIVEHGVTGLLVPPNDPWELADALEELLEAPQLLEDMGSAGRLRLEKFSTSTVGPRIEAAYAESGSPRKAMA